MLIKPRPQQLARSTNGTNWCVQSVLWHLRGREGDNARDWIITLSTTPRVHTENAIIHKCVTYTCRVSSDEEVSICSPSWVSSSLSCWAVLLSSTVYLLIRPICSCLLSRFVLISNSEIFLA